MPVTREKFMSPVVSQWAQDSFGLECYAEVPRLNRGAIDHVAGNAEDFFDFLIGIELKECLSEDVHNQACLNRRYVDGSWAVVNSTPTTWTRKRALDYGYGLAVVRGDWVEVLHEPRHGAPESECREWLTDRMILMAPGGLGGLACREHNRLDAVIHAVEEFVKKHPESTWNDVYLNVPCYHRDAGSLQRAMWNVCRRIPTDPPLKRRRGYRW
jgi:hypothetical protein